MSDSNLEWFVTQIKAQRDLGKDLNLDDVMYGMEMKFGLHGGMPSDNWEIVLAHVLQHWRGREAVKRSRTAALAVD